jgi:peptidase A4-like protein
MTNHQQTDTVRQPPASTGARQSRRQPPAALRTLRRAAMTSPLLLVLTVIAAVPAGARILPPPGTSRVLSPQDTSKNDFFFAGYEAREPVTSVSASFTVPKLTCPNSGILGIAPGVSLTGGTTTEADVAVLCQNGAPHDVARMFLNNSPPYSLPIAINPGDTMAVSVTETPTADMATITDLTQQTSVTKRASSGASNVVARIGDGSVLDNTGLLLGVPPFGTVTFSAAKVNGSALGASSPTPVYRTLFSTLKIFTGALDSTGTSFTTNFQHA